MEAMEAMEVMEALEVGATMGTTDSTETSGVAALHVLPFITMEVIVEAARLGADAVAEVHSEAGTVEEVHSAEGERRATAAAKVDVPSEEEAAVMEAAVMAATADTRSAVTVKMRTSAFIIRCTSRMVQPA